MISFDRLRKLHASPGRDRRGTIAVVTAVAAPLIVGFAGLGVEVGNWQISKRTLQTAADAAALSGALQHVLGANAAGVRMAALADAARNGFVSQTGVDAAVHNPPRSGALAGDPQAVEVVLSRMQRPLVSKVVFGRDVTIGARAVATMRMVGGACVLALDSQASGAVTTIGDATADLANCVVAANSAAADAIDVAGSATLRARKLWTVGGYAQGGSSTLTLQEPATTQAWALPDPFVGITIPAPGSCAHTSKRIDKQTTTLAPGTYCLGIAIGAQADVTFSPGVYLINRGDFSVNGQATIRCNCPGDTGVTIILTGSTGAGQIGRVVIDGGASVDLKAPSHADDPWRGMLFVQDPRASSAGGSGVNRFNGGAQMRLTGAVYFPSEEVQFTGGGGDYGCVEIVAWRVKFAGSFRLVNDRCAAAGVAPIPVTAAQLVE